MKTPTHIEPLETRIAPATFIVTSLLDGVPVKDGQLTLREAVLAATTNLPSGDAKAGDFLLDTITFSPALRGGVIDVLSTLLIDGGGRLSIVGPGLTDESITLRGDGTQRVMQITSATTAVELSHLAIIGGLAASGGGGGILNNSDLSLDDVLISGNTATSSGVGGIASIGANTALTAKNSRFLNNTGGGGDGGAILISGTGARLLLEDTLISGNTSSRGAGIRSSTGTFSTIADSRIVGNLGSTNGDGAGIYNGGTMLVTGTTIAGNTGEGAAFFGGGIRNDGTLTISSSTISGNLSQGRGGGIQNNDGTLTILNSTIAGNTALGSTGGGGLQLAAGTISIINSTIAGNLDATSAAGSGAGGIAAGAGVTSLTMNNTIVAGNFATGSNPADIRGAVTAGGFNFIGIGTADLTGIGNAINGNQIGTAGTPLKARLGALQDNGGPTFTMLPLPGSPVIDAGSFLAAEAPSGAGLLTDQRGPGYTRFHDGDGNGISDTDIGAAEFAPAPAANDATTFSFAVGSGTVTATLTGGGTFDLWRAGDSISQIAIHGATAQSAFALKVSPGGSVNVDTIRSDAGLKSIVLGKVSIIDGSVDVAGALGTLALDQTSAGVLVQTGGTAKNVLKITTGGNFNLVVDTTSAVAALKLPKFNFTGSIRAASIGAITAKAFDGATIDDPLDISSDTRLDLVATVGGIGKLTTTNGGIADYTVQTSTLGVFGGLRVVSKGANNLTALDEVSITAGKIGKISVALTSATDGGNSSLIGMSKGGLTATNGSIASISMLMTHVNTGNKSASGIGQTGIRAAAGIGPITILAPQATSPSGLSSLSINAGTALVGWEKLPTAAAQLAALKTYSLGAIKLTGGIGAVTIAAAGNIGAISTAGGISGKILAGAQLGNDADLGGAGLAADIFLRPASIAAITAGGVIDGSVISAGIASMNGILGDADDVAGLAGLTTIGSKIGPIKIGTATPTVALNAGVMHTKTIQAAAIASIVVGGTALTPTAEGVVLDNGMTAGMDDAEDILIRLR